MKLSKISCKKAISPRGGNFQFPVRCEMYVYLKKVSPQGDIYLAYT